MAEELHRGRWTDCYRPNPKARLRLFCFPYAGGSSAAFREYSGPGWEDIEVCPVQLPGRDKRLWEPPFDRIGPLVETLAEVLPFDRPFALFGHSMGALVSFELARLLRRQRRVGPAQLFASGCSAPQVRETKMRRHLMPQQQLIDELRRLGGTPEEVLRDTALMELISPTIRADFAIADAYEYRPEDPLGCPISAFGGKQDPELRQEQLQAWSEQTSNSFTFLMFPGDHFFLHSARTRLLRVMSSTLHA